MNKWLSPYLKANQMSQKQLAAKLGIDERTLSKKCNGKLQFQYSEVVSICEILHIKNPLDVFPNNNKY